MSPAFRHVLRALLRHYRRHPVQALFLLMGITLANVLLVGTLLINAQARASYEENVQVLGAGPEGTIKPANGIRAFDEREYFRLRRAGQVELLPVLNRTLRTADGELVELLGIDPLALTGVAGAQRASLPSGLAAGGFGLFIGPPYELWASPLRIRQGGWEEGDRLRLADGSFLPPLRAVEGAGLGHRMLLDIGALQALTGSAGELSAIWVFEQAEDDRRALLDALPSGLEYVANAEQPNPARLTRSFHLNLTAMGLLTFVVGAFLIYNAVAFSFTDRQNLISKLRLSGASHRDLAWASVAELVLFLVAGMTLGYWLGGLMAAWLLPGVGQTLAQLYDVHIAYPDRLLPTAVLLPAAMTLLAGALSLWVSLDRTLAAPMLPRHGAWWSLARNARRDRRMLIAGVALLGGSWLLASTASSLLFALLGMAAMLLGAALVLPWLLRLMLSWMARFCPPGNARLSWLVADSRWLLGPAALALMAMVLALVANHGLNAMIGSFRAATDDWLGQRLVADLYYSGSEHAQQTRDWLNESHPEVELVQRLSLREDRSAPGGRPVPVEVVSLPDNQRFRDSIVPMKQQQQSLAKLFSEPVMMISERAWRIEGWRVGQGVALCEAAPNVEIVGVYHDYGNPLAQWMVAETLFRRCWPDAGASGFALLGPDEVDWGSLQTELSRHLQIDPDALVPQGSLREVGLAVFDRTFQVTRALNALTLLVAGIGIFCAISAIHHHRVGQQAQLACLGLSRRERILLLTGQWGLLGLLCAALVWPFGIALAGYLSGVVTPVAFGWSFPLQVQGSHFVTLVGIAAVSLLVAVALPSLRLVRTSPAALLRAENT